MADDFAAALRAEKVGERNDDGSWTCECGLTFVGYIDLYMHRRYDARHTQSTEDR